MLSRSTFTAAIIFPSLFLIGDDITENILPLMFFSERPSKTICLKVQLFRVRCGLNFQSLQGRMTEAFDIALFIDYVVVEIDYPTQSYIPSTISSIKCSLFRKFRKRHLNIISDYSTQVNQSRVLIGYGPNRKISNN